ncbi:branched-chain amino acid ABC transporter permease [Rhodoligotrophos ferricapiens]|uniref:branched-chain amino acid ABC transporter permease n=1 Tax=Rhodoligotrophos ferricapiens TaxID=3069264 RepID=UPI00315D11D2
MFGDLALNGIAVGCVYSLIALGFVLIYKATGILNFAQGDLMMIGGFLGLTAIGIWGLPYWLGFAFAVVATAALGYLLDAVVFRRAMGQPEFALIMLTLGLGYVLRTLAAVVPGWGTQPQRFPTPFDDKTIEFAGIPLSEERLAIIIATLVLMIALYLFFRFSKLGVAMQATAQNTTAASLVGIPVKTIYSLVWALGAGIAAVAGVLIAPITFVHPGMGYVGLYAFPAAVLGGFGSIPGAIVGGLIIGLLEVASGFYLSEVVKNSAPYLVLLLVLFIKPSGLMGVALQRKV